MKRIEYSLAEECLKRGLAPSTYRKYAPHCEGDHVRKVGKNWIVTDKGLQLIADKIEWARTHRRKREVKYIAG